MINSGGRGLKTTALKIESHLMWLFLENPITNAHDNYMRNTGAICIHERVSKRKIYVVCLASGGFAPRPHRGSAPGARWGTSVPQTPSTCQSWLCPTRNRSLAAPLIVYVAELRLVSTNARLSKCYNSD